MENEKIINRLKFILISNLKEYCYVNEIEDITDIKAYRNDIESRGKASIIREKLLLDLQIEYNEIDKEYAERSLDFLKNSTLDFKLNTANIYKSKVKEVERFIYSIEKEINQYRPFMIEDYLTNDEIKYVESGKPKYDNDLIDDKLTDLTGKILLVLMVLAVIITAAFYFNNLEDISFGNILKVGATFIIGLFFVSPMFFLIFIIINIFVSVIYKIIFWKSIKTYNILNNRRISIERTAENHEKILRLSSQTVNQFKEKIASFKDQIRIFENLQKENERRRLEDEELKRQRKIWAEENERRKEIQRKKASFWFNLSGYDFESEVAKLYRRLGFQVNETPYSGDGGADLIMIDKDGAKFIVQCKNKTKPVSPGTARDLLGTIKDYDAQQGLLICSGGFSHKTIEFAKKHKIQLIDVSDLIKMEELSKTNSNI